MKRRQALDRAYPLQVFDLHVWPDRCDRVGSVKNGVLLYDDIQDVRKDMAEKPVFLRARIGFPLGSQIRGSPELQACSCSRETFLRAC